MNSTRTAAARLVTLGVCVAVALYAVFVASSVKGVAEWVTNSDQLTIPAFIVDVFAKPSEVFGWQLPRASYLFPDAIAYGIAYLMIRDPLDAIPLAQVPTLLVWIYLVFRTAPATVPANEPSRAIWAIAVGVLFPLVLTQLSTDIADWVTKYVFSFANHFGCFVFGALLLAWTIDYIYDRSPRRLTAISIVLALVSASNRAIWGFFLIPLYGALILLLIRSPRAVWRQVLALAVITMAAASIGYAVEVSFNRIAVLPYELSISWYARHARAFVESLWTYARARPVIALVLISIVVFYVVAFYRIVVSGRAWWRRDMERAEEKKWLYDAALLLGVILDVFASVGLWDDIGNARYLMPFFFAPVLLVGQVWRGQATRRWLVGGAGCFFAVSAYAFYTSENPGRPSTFGRNETKSLVACLASVNVNRGLANYWVARRLTFLSGGQARLDQLVPWNPDNGPLIFLWGNNAYSFLRGHPSIDPYDYIIVDMLDKKDLENTFGRSSRIHKCEGHEIWKYEDQTRLFARLFQGNIQPYERLLLKDWVVSVPAAIFRGETGSLNGLAREARPEADQAGLLIGGSHFHLKPGKYRVAVSYSYPERVIGSADKIGTFEVADVGGSQNAFADLFADSDQRHGEAEVSLNIDKLDAAIEPRVRYAANGVLRVERISITETARATTEIRLNAADDHLHTVVGVKGHGVVASTGRPGVLLYGPYLPLSAGAYVASVHFASTPPRHSVGTIDVAIDTGETVVARRSIEPSSVAPWGSAYKVDLDFVLAHSVRDLEIRVLVDEAAVVEVSGYEVVRSN